VAHAISLNFYTANAFRTPRAILDMKLQRDKLRQYQKRITVLTDKETAMAKQMLAAGNKSGALLALRRKKYQETLLSKTDSQLAQLEQLTSNVEFALIQKDVMYGIQQGTKVLNEIHAEMGGLEGVEKMMGENEEAIAYQKVRILITALLFLHHVLTCQTGNLRDAQRPYVDARRGGGRGRACRYGGPPQRGQGGREGGGATAGPPCCS
jgi:Snf7 protein